MPKPISHREFLRRLRRLRFTGPEAGGKHLQMTRDGETIFIPNPHRGDLDWTLVKRVLKQAGITKEEWDAVS